MARRRCFDFVEDGARVDLGMLRRVLLSNAADVLDAVAAVYPPSIMSSLYKSIIHHIARQILTEASLRLFVGSISDLGGPAPFGLGILLLDGVLHLPDSPLELDFQWGQVEGPGPSSCRRPGTGARSRRRDSAGRRVDVLEPTAGLRLRRGGGLLGEEDEAAVSAQHRPRREWATEPV